MKRIKNILKSIILQRLLGNILHILRPCIGSADDQRITAAITDNTGNLFTIAVQIIATACIPLYIFRLITDLKNHIIIIFIFRCIFLKEILCPGFRRMRIFCVNMPVYDHIHSQLFRCLNTLLDLLIHSALGSRCVTILCYIACHAEQIDTPLVTKALHRSFIDIIISNIPLNTMGTCPPQLIWIVVLIHDNRSISVACHLLQMKLAMLSNRRLCIGNILCGSGQFII